MRVVGLVSGGKDSCFNMMQCIKAGHEIVALANIVPCSKKEIDSYMYQSVGFEAIDLIADAMELPLFRQETKGETSQTDKQYKPCENDEVEDLYELLKRVKEELKVEAVSCGAILSNYQRVRVENVCIRLGLVSLAYLWQRDQNELLQEMIKCEIDAIVIKVAALGLEPSRHLGRSLRLLEPHLQQMNEQYGLNLCGEGGEYETLTLDCPLFKSRIIIDESEIIIHTNDPICPVGYLKLKQLHLDVKLPLLDLNSRLSGVPLKDSYDYLAGNDFKLSENEILTEITNSDKVICDFTDETVSLQVPTCHASSDGWLHIGGLVGSCQNPQEAVKNVMACLEKILIDNNKCIGDICAVSMFISDMNLYVAMNNEYIKGVSHVNPPVRACVQVPLPEGVHIILEAVAWSSNGVSSGDCALERSTMHVQSVSHWCPANIGPYSQVVQVGDLIHLAGQVGMVPGNMQLVNGGIKRQCQLALRHVDRLLKAMDNNVNLRDVVQGICYVTKTDDIECARDLWEQHTNNAIVDYLVVSGLPRNALIEWHVWAHKHNNQFEYEETGKCIEDWTISLYRRWNYENNTAAVVCHLENTEEKQIKTSIFEEALEYAMFKLLQGHEDDITSICAVKIFYPMVKATKLASFYETISNFQVRYPAVFSLVPVVSLKNSSTHFSICGIRNQ